MYYIFLQDYINWQINDGIVIFRIKGKYDVSGTRIQNILTLIASMLYNVCA